MTTPPPASPGARYICRYCRQPSDPTAATCPLCGAPVDIRAEVSDSGWELQPPIRDMAQLQFGQSHLQVVGTMVPVADFALAPDDWVYFGHHALLWTDTAVTLDTMRMAGGWTRMIAGMPLIMLTAHGPGRIALSDNAAGEVIALPLASGQGIWVREHRLLAATGTIAYDWRQTGVWFITGGGDDRETHYPLGYAGDVFTASGGHGLVLLHAPGNTFVRDLRAGESLLVQPTALVYCDLSVRWHLHLEYPQSPGSGFGAWSRRYNYRTLWLRVVGPGRVAVQSRFEQPETNEYIQGSSYATQRNW